MTEIDHFDENDLQRKIKEILNKSGFHFRITPHDFDLVDKVEKIYIEVKREDFAPAQLLYAIAKRGLKGVEFIGLACDCEVRFYEVPHYEDIESFAREISPNLSKAPSHINNEKWKEKAFNLLGRHKHIYTYQGKLNLNEYETRIFIDQDNYEYFARLFTKYGINPARFLTFITSLYEKNEEIVINNEGRILNLNTGVFFRDVDKDTKQTKLFGDRFNYKPIKDFRDKTLFESTRITSNEINKVLKQMDRLEPTGERREKGRYFTHEKISEEISDIVRMIEPDYILEPFVGTGSLIDPIIDEYKGVANDIVDGYIDTLRKKYKGSGWNFTSLDTITTSYEKLFKEWKIPIGENVMILTNPPFGSVSVSAMASKKGEVEKGKNRNIDIKYGGLGDKYGRGDLVLPAIAKCIEIIKRVGKGYIATFSPAGVMLNRYRYSKLFGALLKDFKFIEGHIFSGENFNSVAAKKAIAFTIWEYKPNYNQNPMDITYRVYEKVYELRRLPLLKEYWTYDNRKKIKGEIGVNPCFKFNEPAPKMIHPQIKKGGSELIQENVRKSLNIANIPDPLIYGLWSISVGYKSITDFPVVFNECYTHLPDFSKTETKEILAYALIYTLIKELKGNYCKGKIGFIGARRYFRFGGERLTEGAKYLIKTYGYCPIGNKTIKEVFNELKEEPDIEKIDDNYRRKIKKEIEKRLEEIGYWDYLPISEVRMPKEEGIAKIKGIGGKTKKTLEEEGYNTIRKIANASIKDLTKISGIGKATAKKFIERAKEQRKGDITYFVEKFSKNQN